MNWRRTKVSVLTLYIFYSIDLSEGLGGKWTICVFEEGWRVAPASMRQ